MRISYCSSQRLCRSGESAGSKKWWLPVALCILLQFPVFAVPTEAGGVSLRVVDEIAPAGGLALIRIVLTEPKPISGGRLTFSFSEALAPAAADAASSSLASSITAVGLLSRSGDVHGSASKTGNRATIDFSSPGSTYGTDLDLPIMVVAVPVSPAAPIGSRFLLDLDISNTRFLDDHGHDYIAEVKQGTLTVGGTSISRLRAPNDNPGPGSVITLEGEGFQQGARVAIESNDAVSTKVLSSRKIEVTFGTGFKIESAEVRLTNPDGSNDRFYAISELRDIGRRGRDDLLGTWPGQGVYSRNSDTGAWTYITSPAKQVEAGDLDGDGRDDIVGNWSGRGVWVKYSSTGQWALLASEASRISLGDLNGDGRVDLIGIWNSAIWHRDSSNGVWSSISSGATKVTAGDLDGDGKDDPIGDWPGSGIWVKYSSSGKWEHLSSEAEWISVGDRHRNGKSHLLGIWNSTIWIRDSDTGAWSSVSSGATQVLTGDLDDDGKDDILGVWPESGLWVRHSSTGSWERLGSAPDSIVAGRLR